MNARQRRTFNRKVVRSLNSLQLRLMLQGMCVTSILRASGYAVRVTYNDPYSLRRNSEDLGFERSAYLHELTCYGYREELTGKQKKAVKFLNLKVTTNSY